LDFTEQFLSALHFLQQADNHMSVGNTARAVELLKLVNEEATKGSPITEDLVICPKLLILVDTLFESIIPATSESDTLYVTPINKLEMQQKRNISVHVASHVQTMVRKIGMDDLGDLMRLCTMYYDMKKEHDKDSLQQVFNDCSQWLLPKTVKIDDDTLQITLPSFTILPRNPRQERESTKIFRMRIPAQDASQQHSLSLWIGDVEVEWGFEPALILGFCGQIYVANANSYTYEDKEGITVTIRNKKLVSISPGSLLENERINLTKRTLYDYWKPEHIMAVAESVVCGDITEVDTFILEAADYRNFHCKTDLEKVEQIIPVIRRYFVLDLSNGLEMMGVEFMRKLADKAGGMEKMMMSVPLHLERENWCIGLEGQGYEMEVGRLLTRAKMAIVENTSVLRDFTLFIQGIIQGLVEKGANCETMMFEKIDTEHKEKIMEWGERLGWSIEEGVEYRNVDQSDMDIYYAIKLTK